MDDFRCETKRCRRTPFSGKLSRAGRPLSEDAAEQQKRRRLLNTHGAD